MNRNVLLENLLKIKIDNSLTVLETSEYYHNEYIEECEIETDEIARFARELEDYVKEYKKFLHSLEEEELIKSLRKSQSVAKIKERTLTETNLSKYKPTELSKQDDKSLSHCRSQSAMSKSSSWVKPKSKYSSSSYLNKVPSKSKIDKIQAVSIINFYNILADQYTNKDIEVILEAPQKKPRDKTPFKRDTHSKTQSLKENKENKDNKENLLNTQKTKKTVSKTIASVVTTDPKSKTAKKKSPKKNLTKIGDAYTDKNSEKKGHFMMLSTDKSTKKIDSFVTPKKGKKKSETGLTSGAKTEKTPQKTPLNSNSKIQSKFVDKSNTLAPKTPVKLQKTSAAKTPVKSSGRSKKILVDVIPEDNTQSLKIPNSTTKLPKTPKSGKSGLSNKTSNSTRKKDDNSTNNVTAMTQKSNKSNKKEIIFGGNTPKKLNMDRLQHISLLPNLNNEELLSDKNLLNCDITKIDQNMQEDLFQKGDITLLSVLNKTDDFINQNIINVKYSIVDLVQAKWNLFSKKLCLSELKVYYENLKSNIEAKLNEITKKYSETELQNEIIPFSLSKGALKALELLNDSIHTKFFSSSEDNISKSDDILFIYKIYFQFLNMSELFKSKTNEEFWLECRNYFINKGKTLETNTIGNIINKSLSSFDFSYKNVFELVKFIGNDTQKVNLTYYSKMCSTTGFLVFVLKDSLEYIGILPDKKASPVLIYRIYSDIKDEIQNNLEYLNKITK